MWSKLNNIFISITLTLVVGMACLFIRCGNSSGNAADRNESANNATIQTEDFREKELSPSEFISWYKNDGMHLRKSVKENELQFKLEYRPPLYMALQEIQSDEITRAQLDTVLKNYSGLIQFKLEIANTNSGEEFIKADKPDGVTYEERVKYFSFGMQKDISMVSNGDTIPCAMFHFERSYGASPQSVFMIGFAADESLDDFDIIIHEKVFTNKKLKFDFTKEEVTNLPQLKTL